MCRWKCVFHCASDTKVISRYAVQENNILGAHLPQGGGTLVRMVPYLIVKNYRRKCASICKEMAAYFTSSGEQHMSPYPHGKMNLGFKRESMALIGKADQMTNQL